MEEQIEEYKRIGKYVIKHLCIICRIITVFSPLWCYKECVQNEARKVRRSKRQKTKANQEAKEARLLERATQHGSTYIQRPTNLPPTIINALYDDTNDDDDDEYVAVYPHLTTIKDWRHFNPDMFEDAVEDGTWDIICILCR